MKLSPLRLLFGAFLALWALSLTWFGAVTPAAVATLAAGNALLWVASIFLLAEPVRASRLTLAVGAAAAAVVALHLLPLPDGPFPFTSALRARHGVAGSAPGTGDLFLTVRQLAQIASYVLAGLFMKRLVDAGLTRMAALAGFVAVLALEGLYAVVQVGFSLDSLPFYGPRPYPDCATGTLVNRNNFAGMMAMGLALAAGAAWARFTTGRNLRPLERLQEGVAWALAAALFGACIVLSKSRGGALAAGAGLATLPFLVRRRIPAAAGAGLLLLVAFGAAAVWASNTDPLVERFQTIDPDRVESDTRVRCWEAATEGWKRQPVLGFGIGTFPETFRPFQPASLPGQFQHAHNEYVNVLFEGGVVWLAVLALAAGAWCFHALRGLRRLEGSERAAAAACIAAAVAVAVHALVDFDLRITSVGMLFAATLGVALPYDPDPPAQRRVFAIFPALAAVAIALPLWFAELEPQAPALRVSLREPPAAEIALAAILRRSPYDPIVVSLQALQAERREDFALAADRLQTATELWPSNPDFQRDAALWFLDQGDRTRANACFRRFFAQNPSAVGKTLEPLWSADDPIAPWEPCMPSPGAVAHFSAFLARLNRWEDAAAVFGRGVPAEAKYAQLYDQLSESLREAGQWGLEASVREKRLALKSDPAAHAAAAAVWARLEAWDKSLDHARIATRIDPGRADWQALLAKILEAKGDGVGALEALTAALGNAPDDEALRLNRADLCVRQKLFHLAADDYRVVRKKSPGSRAAAIGLARALTDAGLKTEALGEIQGWLNDHPDDGEAVRIRVELLR